VKKFIYISLFLLFLSGCRNETKDKTLAQIQTLKIENTSLVEQVAKSQKENEQLTKQIQTLRSLGATLDYKDIYNLQKVTVTRYTTIDDSNSGGKKKELIVYLQPIDETGDIIKASGIVDVQLWDLDKPQTQALLGQWKVEPGQLKKMWYSTFLRINYRLVFDVSKIVAKYDHPLTVKVKFTDYLSGKQFEDQREIKPQ
jgi:hypothetical protein